MNMGPTLRKLIVDQAQKIVRKAKQLQRTFGVRASAGYLRNQGVSFEEAHLVIFGRMPRA